MKTDQVNLRLEADLIAALEKAAEAEALDRGTMMRKLLREALGRWQMERAFQRYQSGDISVGRAAEEAGLTHWDLLQLARARGVAYPLSPEEAEARLGAMVGKASRVADRPRGPAAGKRQGLRGQDTLPDRPPSRGGILLVGINPAPISVRAGHYYQGRIGGRLWKRLARLGLLPNATPGREDDAFVAVGHGLTDIAKRPTRSADELEREELVLGAEALRTKVRSWSPRLVLFVFREAARSALGDRAVSPGPCPLFEGVPTFLLTGPYASRDEADRVDARLIEVLGATAPGEEGMSMTQPVTANDIENGRIRLPREAEGHFPARHATMDVILRGQRLHANYDPGSGPDRKRSAVVRVGRKALSRLVRPGERLRVQIGTDGLVSME